MGTSFLELMYVKSSIFLRDVFQYLISGALFIVLTLLALRFHKADWSQLLIKSHGQNILMDLLMSIVLAYVLGHFFFGACCFPLDWYYRKSTSIQRKKKSLRTRLASIDAGNDALIVLGDDVDCHLYYEISAFRSAPELHTRFVERYNVLMHMRTSLASCFFFAFWAYFGLFGFQVPFICVGGVFLVLSLFLFWQCVQTYRRFLDRVYMVYLVGEEMEKR